MEARLCYIGHGLMENRSGLIVDTRLTKVSGHAERLAALEMIEPWGERSRAITLGEDKGYDARDFVMKWRELNVRSHLARNTSGRRSAIDRRTTRLPGYVTSQRVRKRIEEAFGWIKSVAGLRQIGFRGRDRVDLAFTFAADIWDCDYLDLIEPACWASRPTDSARSPSMPCRQASTSSTVAPWLSSPGTALTKWTRCAAPAPPNFRTTAPSRSSLPTTMATRPLSKPNASLL